MSAAMEEVRPTFLASPSVIWFVTELDTAYETLLTQTMKANEQKARHEGEFPWHTPKKDEVVMLWCLKARVWCRALVTKIFVDPVHKPSSSLVVFLIDYGTTAEGKLIHVRQLPNDPNFRDAGKAKKLILYGLVPISKITVFVPEEQRFQMRYVYSKDWDYSTYEFMENILSQETKFYFKKIQSNDVDTTLLGNKIYFGDLFVLVGDDLQSISTKLTTDKYGVRNAMEFKQFLGESDLGAADQLVGPVRPLCARTWQVNIDKLAAQQESTEEEDNSPVEFVDPFVATPEEIEASKKLAEAKAAKAKEQEDEANALATFLEKEKAQSEELKMRRYNPQSFSDKLKFLMEEESLRNSAKELAGVVPVWEGLPDDEDSLVHFRTAYDPSNIFVVLSMNIGPLATLQEEISSFSLRHPWLLGQVAATVGTYCLALYSSDKVWYRACITAVTCDSRVDVFYLDVGDNDSVDRFTEIMPVSKYLITLLPFQAVECSLYGVLPAGGKKSWHEEATEEVCRYCVNDDGVSLELRARRRGHAPAQHTGGRKFKVILSSVSPHPERSDSLNRVLVQLLSVQGNVDEPFPVA